MEGRMTFCNMTIEAGARAGLIAPDETTFAYVAGRPRAPKAAAFEAARPYWRTLKSDDDATFDAEIVIDAHEIVPMVTWGTSPEQALPITARVPDPGRDRRRQPARRRSTRARLYGFDAGHGVVGCEDRPRLHRLLHQWPHRGFARGRRHRKGQKGRAACRRDGRAGLRPCEGAGRGRRPRRDLPSKRDSNGASRAARCASP